MVLFMNQKIANLMISHFSMKTEIEINEIDVEFKEVKNERL